MRFGRYPIGFALAFGGAGLVVVSIGLLLVLTQHYRLATYVPVQARIVSSKVVRHHSSKHGDTFQPAIRYGYEVAGKHYECDRVAPVGQFSDSSNWAWQMVRNFPPGRKVTAWRSPTQPARAFLVRATFFFPHGVAMFGFLFVCVGAVCLLMHIENSREPTEPVALMDGWFSLAEQGTIQGRFWFWVTVTIGWFAFYALVFGDWFVVNGHRMDTVSTILAAVALALGISGIVIAWRRWELWHDFLDAELCAKCDHFEAGELLQLRVRQGVRRDIDIEQLTVTAICIRSDRTTYGGKTRYTSTEIQEISKKLAVNGTCHAGGEVEATTEMTLPADAEQSSARGDGYPFFQWYFVLRVDGVGEPALEARFPIRVQKALAAAAV